MWRLIAIVVWIVVAVAMILGALAYTAYTRPAVVRDASGQIVEIRDDWLGQTLRIEMER